MSARLRRVVPAEAAVSLAEAAGRLLWRVDRRRRARARAAATAILSRTGREDEIDRVARGRISEELACTELSLRPSCMKSAGMLGADNLEAAMAGRRGVIVSKVHAGVIQATFPITARYRPSYAVGSDWLLEPQPPGRGAHESAAMRTLLGECGGRVLRARGSYPLVAELLRRGAAVTITFDMAGPAVTGYLGKRLMLADGTARLALETGAIVLPCITRRQGARLVAIFEPPLDPDDFNGPGALQAALGDVHTRLALAAPEAIHDPCRLGHWGPQLQPVEDASQPEAAVVAA